MKHKKKYDWLLFAALVTIFFWFIIGAMFICCKMRAAKIKGNGKLRNIIFAFIYSSVIIKLICSFHSY